MSVSQLTEPEVIGRFILLAFFAAVFLQSSLDKVFDWSGNLSYFRKQFKDAALVPQRSIPLLLATLTVLELAAGVVSVVAIVSLDFAHRGFGIAATAVALAGLDFVALILGQRLAKDYGGAHVIATYFAVAIVGLALFF